MIFKVKFSNLELLTGVEGGIWHPARGFVAYAFPTYEGKGPKLGVTHLDSNLATFMQTIVILVITASPESYVFLVTSA